MLSCDLLTLFPSLLQVFVNFAKDQSDDYHSKDSVRRRDAPPVKVGSQQGAVPQQDSAV